jgi:O-antigen/teichoic acid export membrane protein
MRVKIKNMLKDFKKLVKHTTIYGLGTVLSKAVGFLLIPLYTHYLSPDDYGVLELLDLSITVAGIFIGMGISASIFRFYYHYEDTLDKNEVVSTALIFVVLFATSAVSLAILNTPIISKLVFKSSEFSPYFKWMFISLLFSIIASVPEAYIMAQQRSALFTAISVGTLALNLSLNIYVVAFLEMGVLGIVCVSAFVRAVNTCLLLLLTLPGTGLTFSISKLKQMLRYGLPLLPANFGLFAINFSDRFFLSHLSSLSAVGIYSLGYKLGFIISILLVQPFSRIWQAQLFELAERNDAHKIMGRLFTYFCYIIIFAIVVLSLLSKDVIKIVSPRHFWPAYKVVPIIATACFFRGAYIFFQAGILVRKETKLIGYTVFFVAVFSLVLNYFLIKYFGFIGASLSFSITSLILAYSVHHFSTRLFRVDYEFVRILKLITVAVCLIVPNVFIQIDSIIISILVRLSISILFPVALVLTGFYTTNEKEKLLTMTYKSAKTIRSLAFFRNMSC